MAVRTSSVAAGPLRTLMNVGVIGGLSDGQLLERLATGAEETVELAFEAIIERHGPMVFRTCRRILDDANDVDDAFQATFLVLFRHSGSIRGRKSIASWLHGVAIRVAARARVEGARRRRIEARAVRPAIEWETVAERRLSDAMIHEELSRLPEKYRAPIVLCYLEGLTHEGAARELGWPVGTVRGRLSRARELLRARLTRRGITASAALAALGSLAPTARAVVPAALRDAAVQSAVEITSVRVAAWAAGASSGIGALSHLRMAVGLIAFVGALGTGLALVMGGSPAPGQKPPPPPQLPAAVREANRRELLQLQGTWTSMQMITDRTVNGVPQPPKPFKLIWSIDRDMLTTSDENGFADNTFRVSIDRSLTPSAIDFTLPKNGLTLRGIYKRDGENLTVCYDYDRPAEFRAHSRQYLMVFHRVNRVPTQLTSEYENATGCYWAISPKVGVPSSVGSDGVEVFLKKDATGSTTVTMAYMTKLIDGKPDIQYRPVAFDARKTRYVLKSGQGGSCGASAAPGVALEMHEYRLDADVLPFDQLKNLGIEAVPAEARRAADEAASVEALRQAREIGVEILPRPVVGKPFEFTLTTRDGRKVSSAAFQGKVVLIDCWAGWCSPCMAKMPGLKALYERRHGDGLEVVGVNFDHDKDHANAERLIKSLALPWPEVFVPIDDRTRLLWGEGPGIASLPRLFLIDREGILRWDGGGPGELEERIAALLDGNK